MLDANVEKIFSFQAVVPEKKEVRTGALVIRECEVNFFSNGRIYSELEELTFNTLNQNMGLGALDIQFSFVKNITDKAYPLFFTKCFVFLTDKRFRLKPMKVLNTPSYSKINKNGELTIGIRYFFQNEKEISEILSCNEFLVEGFIALENKKNVYGIMCQMVKKEAGWEIVSTYTYKPDYARNIKNLID